VILASNGMLV